MKRLLFLFICIPIIGFTQTVDNSIYWLELQDAERLAADSDKNMLLFFYRENCEYCEKMKEQTLSDPSVVKLINDHFFPVMLDGKSKDPIMYNNKEYLNDKPNVQDAPYFHNLYKELVDMKDGNYYWPTIVIINGKHEKIIQGQGFWPKEQTLRNLAYIISK